MLLTAGLVSFMGCSSSSDEAPTGIFTDSPVSGLNYRTTYINDVTDGEGKFKYDAGSTVTFSIGNLVLGSATGASQLTPLSITPGATLASDQIVNNKLILLQTLDADGNLNNGIQITEGIRTIVSANAASINFNQATDAFIVGLAPLVTTLNGAKVFTDASYRGARAVRTASAALTHFERATAARVTVDTIYGKLSGFELDAATWQWLGVPYAKPPIGDLRWKPPVPPTAWTGVRNAIAYGPWTPQTYPTAAWSGRVPESEMSEDCLYLNITAPKNASKLPVLVWLHGGGLNASSANMPTYNVPYLSQRGAVVVTVNQRLGALGYLAHSLLKADSSYGGSGNYGQMDIIAALQWIKSNIAAFGGDPDRVAVFGQSGGGARTVFTLATPLAKGLFHGGIIEAGIGAGTGGGSAAYYIFETRELAEANGQKLSDALGASTLAELRSKTWQQIIAATNSSGFETRWTVDGYALPDTVWNIFASGQKNDVPIMIGGGEGEPLKHQGTAVWAPVLLNGNANMYVYVFSQLPTNWKNWMSDAGATFKAYHGLEVPYQFGCISSILNHYNVLFAAPQGPPPLPRDPGLDDKDDFVTDAVMKMWIQFAKTGNPSVSGIVTWPAFGLASGQDNYLNIAYPLEVKSDFLTTYAYP
ncbi:MAG: carboxylesterase family protein [Deltaproteobacteria bacterium]|nr:carboxylesterase family protein [Deltaproteobacteria bacterium]